MQDFTRHADGNARAIRRLPAVRDILGFLFIVIIAGAVMVPVSPVMAQRRPVDPLARIQPRVTDAQFNQYLTDAQVNRETRTTLAAIFAEYTMGLETVLADLEAREEAAGIADVEAALSGARSIDSEDLRVLRADVAYAERPVWADADAAARRLLADIDMLVSGEERDRLAQALPALRREIYLGPIREEASDPSYAGDGFDLMRVLEAAQMSGAELEGLPPAVLRPAIQTWVATIDAIGPSFARQRAEVRIDQRLSRILRDPSGAAAADEAFIEAWLPVWRAHDEATRSIEAIVRQQRDDAAALAFRDRARSELFPSLAAHGEGYFRTLWMKKHVTEADRAKEADAIAATWRTERRRLIDEAIQIMLAARINDRTIIHPRSDSTQFESDSQTNAYQALLRNSGRLQRADTDARDGFEMLLTPRERKSMAADVRARALGRRF